VVLDEAYFEYVHWAGVSNGMDYFRKLPIWSCSGRFSKIYGLAGVRLGYGIMQSQLTGYLHRTRMPFNLSSLAQAGGVAALDDLEHVRTARETAIRGLQYLEQELLALGLKVPKSHATSFLRIWPVGKANLRAASAPGIITRPLPSYGFPNALRISVGLASQNERLVAAAQASALMRSDPLIVAIDGPAGAGKSTVSKILARRLQFSLVDTGAIYRCVALLALRKGIALDDDARLEDLLNHLTISFQVAGEEIRVMWARRMCLRQFGRRKCRWLRPRFPPVRRCERDFLRFSEDWPLSRAGGDPRRPRHRYGRVPGRGPQVLSRGKPDARARRRYEELFRKGVDTSLGEVLSDQTKRDRDDSTRAVAPLRAAPDAIRMDSTQLPISEVVQAIEKAVRASLGAAGPKLLLLNPGPQILIGRKPLPRRRIQRKPLKAFQQLRRPGAQLPGSK